MARIKATKVCLVLPGALLVLMLSASISTAEDWPQFLGPRRDGSSKETGLLASWPKSGPPVLWQKEVGEGYSAPVIAGGKLILHHRKGDKEIVTCLDAAKGDKIWEQTNPTNYQDGLGKGDGPRSTPALVGDRVYTLGPEGWLQALQLKDGKRLWGHNVVRAYDVPSSYFGVATSSVVEGKRLLVNVGGKKAGIVAFDIDTGKEVWKATTDGASYASPVVADFNGKRRAVFFTRFGVAVLDPAQGDVVFHKRWRARYDASVNAATPLVIGDVLFVSTSYETGALLLKADGAKFSEVWNNDESMSNHYNTCVYQQGHLYGIDGRQESKPRLRCVQLMTGRVKWTQPAFGCASLILAEGRVIALTEKGELVLFEATPTEYKELARAEVLNSPPCRAQLALSNSRLYARDQGRLVCWNLKK